MEGRSVALRLFPGGAKFKLMKKPPVKSHEEGRACDVCAMPVKGEVYHCKEEGLDVHPTCARLDDSVRVGDFVFNLRKGQPESECSCCRSIKPIGSHRNIEGFHYQSPRLGHTFHVFCMKGMPRSVPPPRRPPRTPATRRNSEIDAVLQTFFTTVFSILVGDPSAVLASAIIQIISFSHRSSKY